MTFSCLTKEEVRKKYKQAENKSEMLHILADLTCSTPEEVAALLGVTPPAKRRYGALDEKKAAELLKSGASDREIAEVCCVAIYVIAQWRKANGLTRRKTLFQSQEIETLYKQGLNDGEIAKKLNCSRSVAAQWRRLNELPPNWEPRSKRRRRRKKGDATRGKL